MSGQESQQRNAYGRRNGTMKKAYSENRKGKTMKNIRREFQVRAIRPDGGETVYLHSTKTGAIQHFWDLYEDVEQEDGTELEAIEVLAQATLGTRLSSLNPFTSSAKRKES
jgi:hypothetical protein